MILTNEWTKYPHGHARTELRLAKILLERSGISSQILSVSSDFGDIQAHLKKSLLVIPKQLVRGPVYRKKLINQEKILAASWGKIISELPKNTPLVITSGFWSQLIQVLRNKQIGKVKFRLISPPMDNALNKQELQLVFNSLKFNKLTLAIETLDGVEFLNKKLGISASFVPPLTTYAVSAPAPSKIGIIWSVTDQSSILEIKRIINLFENCNLLIKLPLGIEFSELRCTNTRIELIPNGISDEQFELYLGQLKSAYLPHKNYVVRGSGLITSMMGSGITVLVNEENSFFRDFDFSKLILGTNNENLEKNIQKLLESDDSSLDRELESEKIRTLIIDRWSDFLGVSHG